MMDEAPFGVYIHIPFCRAKCRYCAFVSTADKSLERAYIDALIREIKAPSNIGRAVDSIYIGGGTPSCLSRGAIAEILNAVHDTFSVARGSEITVEANPESCTEQFAAECKDAGVNRISMGLQSADDDVLRAIGRVHTFPDYLRAAKLLQKSFDNISSDIILGLPEQDEPDIDKALSVISDYCCHASVYALSVEEGTPLYSSGFSTDDDRIADMYDRACSRLAALGFRRYEVSNFAKSGKESRHNKKYWNCEGYYGFGVAAHGYDGDYIRYSHTDDIAAYIRDYGITQTILTEKDRYNEYIMLRLRTDCGIVLNDFKARFGYEFTDRAAAVLSRLAADGLIVARDGRVRIAPDKAFVMNGIIEELMLD